VLLDNRDLTCDKHGRNGKLPVRRRDRYYHHRHEDRGEGQGHLQLSQLDTNERVACSSTTSHPGGMGVNSFILAVGDLEGAWRGPFVNDPTGLKGLAIPATGRRPGV